MNDDERVERAKRFSKIWWDSRAKSGKSQEYMALGLGVSKKTIQNWEKGVSSPTFFQSSEWFRLLGQNPIHYYLEFLFPGSTTVSDNDEELTNALIHVISNMTSKEKQQLLYLIVGEHGSSWYGLLQMFTAHCHTSIKSRVTVARTILDQYEMEASRSNLVCPDITLPDVEMLEKSIENAKESVKNGNDGYTLTDEQ